MFFHYENFTDILSVDQAKAIAKKADKLMEENAILVFGTVYADGSAEDFSTTKKATDTHVGMLIGAEQMAAFKPSKSYIKKDALTDAELKRAMGQRIDVLESLVKQSGGGSQ